MSKARMYRTFKAAIFGQVATPDGKQSPVATIVDGHLVIDNDHCDLRPAKERYSPETKRLAPSAVESILCAESVLTRNYGRRIGDHNVLYDFVTVDCSGGNDANPEVKRIKDKLCYDGLYLPFDKLEAVGYAPHDESEIVTIACTRYVRYRAAMQSASENRQTKLTMTTYRWDNFARVISANARYLSEPTQTAQKSLSRQGLGKTSGKVVEGFDFTFAVVPDLETDVTFNARCFNDAKNEITAETLTATKTATDGCGFVTSAKARELAAKLGLSYVPSAFQVRYGQVKGVLLVFDFDKYTDGAVKEDILFTQSMWKSDFDVSKARFLVANVSKPPRTYAEWNYQMFTTLNSNVSFDDIQPYAEDIRRYMERALSTPEDALKFLGVLSSIADVDSDNGDGNQYACVDKVSAVITANPQLAMNIRWVRQAIKRKVGLVSRKMLGGKIPMPYSSIAIMAADPLAFFNRLRVDEAGNYGFEHGVLVTPIVNRVTELAAHAFYYGGHEGELLAFRNPLTHHAQIRKLNCVSCGNVDADTLDSPRNNGAYWYRHLNQVVLFNAHDETNLGMGGGDFDGDQCFLTKLFVDKFRQADYIIFNANDTGAGKQQKAVLTEKLAQKSIRANLQQNQLGLICNINTRALELMNDEQSLRQFVLLAGYMGDTSFGTDKIAQTPYYPKFKDVDTARAYLERLNHELTTLSELEVDRPKTGYINRFCQNQQEYSLPYTPYWFGRIKNQLEPLMSLPAEAFGENRLGEHTRTLCRRYNCDGEGNGQSNGQSNSNREIRENRESNSGLTVKVIRDTLKTNRRQERWVQRAIELMTDGDTIMGNLQRFVQREILGMEINADACFSIIETLKGASILDLDTAESLVEVIRPVYKSYCRAVAANIRAMKDGYITEEEFNDALDHIVHDSDERLRAISPDRAALAYAAYVLSLENGYCSQSFPFLTVLDGMCALLADVRKVDYYDISINPINRAIPDEATHLIVYNRKFRLPESVCPNKVYFGDVNLPNGSYELHRDLKGGVSLIVPKAAPKVKLNAIPFSDTAAFSLKLSYKASELAAEHQNGQYVTGLMAMADNPVTFRETTMSGNTQYCVYIGDTWVGTIFDDQSHHWVLRKEVARTLMGKAYRFVEVPRTGVKTDSNSFFTSNGTPRTAQVLTFTQSAATLTAANTESR